MKYLPIIAALALAGCGTDLQEFNDSPRIGNIDTGAITISMPDGFSNLAVKCVGTDLAYSTMNTNGRAVAVSPRHPWCEDEVLTKDETER